MNWVDSLHADKNSERLKVALIVVSRLWSKIGMAFEFIGL